MQQPDIKDFVINDQTLPVISQLAESMPGGFFIYRADNDMELIYCNSRMYNIFGCDSEQEFRSLVHNSFRGIVHPDDFETVNASINNQISQTNDATDRVQYRFVRKDGSIGLLRDCGRFIKSDTYGGIYYVFADDISNASGNSDLYAVISALSDDYDAMFHIDLISSKVNFYGECKWLDDELLANLENANYEEKMLYIANKFVFKDDRDYFCKSLALDNVLKQISEGLPLVIRYHMIEDGKLQWYELKAVHHKEHVGKKCAMIGIRNVQKEMEQQEQLNDIIYKNTQHLLAFHEIIHSGMWTMILNDKREILTVKWSDEYRHLLGYEDETDFPDVFSSWYDKVHPDEKQQALDAFWKGARQEDPFDIDFRVLNKNGTYRWYHAAGRVEDNNDGTFTYFGIFVDATAEHENEAYQQTQKQNLDIIEILASEYSSVYYIDLRTDGLKPYTMNSETESEFGQIFNSGISYSEAFKMYVEKLILLDDRKMMLEEGSVANIRRRLAKQKTFITHYRSSDNRFNEMKFVKVGKEDEEPTAVALGFADKDEELREELDYKRYSEIANVLSEKYDTIYYVDTNDNSYVRFHSQGSKIGLLAHENNINFFEDCFYNVPKMIHPDDVQLVMNFIQKDNLIEEVKKGSAILSEYRTIIDGNINFYNMRAVRSSQDDYHIILALENVTETVLLRQQEQEKLQQNYQIIEILASEYTSVYHINMENDALTPYTMNVETETKFGSIFRSGIAYTEAFKLFVAD